jgi:hypothetical protein
MNTVTERRRLSLPTSTTAAPAYKVHVQSILGTLVWSLVQGILILQRTVFAALYMYFVHDVMSVYGGLCSSCCGPI